MSAAPSSLRDFARHFVVHEMRGGRSSKAKKTVALQACERLRPHLATLMGSAGVRALLARALVLAHPDVPWLRTVRVRTDGSLEVSDELEAQTRSQEIAEGETALLAQLLGLLVAFIGESLTLRMVREVWPRVALENLQFGTGERNEKKP